MHKLIKEENFIQRHQELERFKRRQGFQSKLSVNTTLTPAHGPAPNLADKKGQ